MTPERNPAGAGPAYAARRFFAWSNAVQNAVDDWGLVCRPPSSPVLAVRNLSLLTLPRSILSQRGVVVVFVVATVAGPVLEVEVMIEEWIADSAQ